VISAKRLPINLLTKERKEINQETAHKRGLNWPVKHEKHQKNMCVNPGEEFFTLARPSKNKKCLFA
jgi:hypothetical protein